MAHRSERLRALLPAALAVPLVLVTSLRVARGFPRSDLTRLVDRLRRGRSFRGPLRDPLAHARAVGRLLPHLWPRDMGPCLKRSLILVHLWSRCGLEPRLHLGTYWDAEGRRAFHAWLTAPDGAPLPGGGEAAGCEEITVV
jgi:hypothetical protein